MFVYSHSKAPTGLQQSLLGLRSTGVIVKRHHGWLKYILKGVLHDGIRVELDQLKFQANFVSTVDAYYRGNKDICSFEQIIPNMTVDSVCNSYYPVVVTNHFSENLHLYAGVMIACPHRIWGRIDGKLAKCLPHHG